MSTWYTTLCKIPWFPAQEQVLFLCLCVSWETQNRMTDVASILLTVKSYYFGVVTNCRQHLVTKSDHHCMQWQSLSVACKPLESMLCVSMSVCSVHVCMRLSIQVHTPVSVYAEVESMWGWDIFLYVVPSHTKHLLPHVQKYNPLSTIYMHGFL